MQVHKRLFSGKCIFCALLAIGQLLSMPLLAQSLPDNFFPESIAASSTGRIFVGSHTESRIVEIPAGATASQPFVSTGANGLMSVQGLLADDARGILWACTADLGASRTPKGASALLAFDLDGGGGAGRWTLPDDGFCNDITFGPRGNLLITDTSRDRILGFDLQGRRFSTWIEHPLLGGQPFNGNGIAVERANVFVSTFADGRLLRIPVNSDGSAGDPVEVALPRPLRGGDAIRTVGPDRLLVFENGLPHGGGQVTLALIEDDRAILVPIVSDVGEPTSGLLIGSRLLVVDSQFVKLYGAKKGAEPDAFSIHSFALDSLPSIIPLPAGPAYPNGIAVAPDGTIFTGFVASGLIFRKRPGNAWDTMFPGSDAVYAGTSLRLDAERNLLWGTSPDFLVEGRKPRPNRLFALDADTGASRHLIDLPDGSFGNDTAIEPGGAVLLTESFLGQVLRLPRGAERFEVKVAHPALAPPPGGIGVAGIVRAPDGRLILANYGTGKLFVVELDGAVRQILLPRLLANPDGLALASDSALIVCEGDVDDGNGRVLRIPDPFADSDRPIQILAEGLESPVNLSLSPQGTLLVTEARIRHRLTKVGTVPAPESFKILSLPLSFSHSK